MVRDLIDWHREIGECIEEKVVLNDVKDGRNNKLEAFFIAYIKQAFQGGYHGFTIAVVTFA